MNLPPFSVIINTYNRLPSLKSTLRSLRRQRYPNIEIIIVCGPCTDGTQEWLAHNVSDCKIISIDDRNLSCSRNAGLRAAGGEFVAFIDDDAIAEPNWLSELAHAFQTEEIVAAGGFVHDHTGYDYQAEILHVDRTGRTGDPQTDLGSIPWEPKSQLCYTLMGTNVAFRRSAVFDIGGFDEKYVYFLEETDLLLRLMDAGGQMALRPLARVLHKFADSHLRDNRVIIRADGYRTIAFSQSYFFIRAHEGLDKPPDYWQQLAKFREYRKAEAWQICEAGLVSNQDFEESCKAIDEGGAKGLQAAFFQARVKALKNDDAAGPAFKPIPALLPAGSRIRLALITPEYPPKTCGGVGVFIHKLAVNLAKRGHEITVITMSDSHDRVDLEDDVWVHRLSPHKEVKRHSGLPAQLPAPRANYASRVQQEVMRTLPIRQFDYAIGSIWDLDMAGLIAGGLVPVGLYLVTSMLHVSQYSDDWQPDTDYYKDYVLPMVEAEKWALREADTILASTAAIAEDISRLYGIDLSARAHLLPFGIEDSRAASSRKIDDRTLRILFVGRLEARKGIDLLLQAAPELLERFCDMEIHIIGRDVGGFRTDFEEKNQGAQWRSRLLFHGEVNDDELHQHYADCDIFVAPSRYESFGLIFVEAMRYCKPVIGIACGGVPSIVKDGQNGLLIDHDDGGLLAGAIARLAEDGKLRERLGKAGRQDFEDKYTIDAYVSKMEAFLKSQIRRPIK